MIWVPYICGAKYLSLGAVTLSSMDGCFQAYLRIVTDIRHPFPLNHLWGPYWTIWAVSLSTLDLRTQGLSMLGHINPVFGVCLPLVRYAIPRPEAVLYPRSLPSMLYFNKFRRKPAISVFDWPFTPKLKSSQSFATDTGSVLQCVSPRYFQPVQA